jgi:hypothetical protein
MSGYRNICKQCNAENSFVWDFCDNINTINTQPCCSNCGLVRECDEIFSYQSGGGQSLESGDVDEFSTVFSSDSNSDNREKSFKASYKRSVFLYERFSQNQRKEPRIPDDDLAEITSAHIKLMDSNPIYKEATKNVNKTVIHTLLRFVDERNCKKEKKETGTTNPKSIRKFRQLYLEKWLSIAEKVFGASITSYSPEEYAKVGHITEQMSHAWDRMQNNRNRKNLKMAQEDKECFKIKGRKHIPFINCLVRFAHSVVGISKKYDKLWPLPKSEVTRKKVAQYICEICEELKIEPPTKTKNKSKQNTLDAFLK